MKNVLKDCKFAFEIIQHEKPLLSAKEGADYFGIEIEQTAPTLIIKTERGLLQEVAEKLTLISLPIF
ncbi:hypothetical protein [Bacillus norwichensis]|uniref:hypothetical protein n=1 Tax=Bacillus norwichensis TaxID=2762217 RepID=UPI001CD85F18|nr:hypothetical protein [Bacillus norwichensis]